MAARLWPDLERCPKELAGSYSEQTLSHWVWNSISRLLQPRLSSLLCTCDLRFVFLRGFNSLVTVLYNDVSGCKTMNWWGTSGFENPLQYSHAQNDRLGKKHSQIITFHKFSHPFDTVYYINKIKQLALVSNHFIVRLFTFLLCFQFWQFFRVTVK